MAPVFYVIRCVIPIDGNWSTRTARPYSTKEQLAYIAHSPDSWARPYVTSNNLEYIDIGLSLV